MCNYAEAAQAVGLDSIWLSDNIVSRNPTPDITCMFATTARCTVKRQNRYSLYVEHVVFEHSAR